MISLFSSLIAERLALPGTGVFVLLQLAGAPALPAGLTGVTLAFAVRAGAIVFGWSLPGFPGRAPPAEP